MDDDEELERVLREFGFPPSRVDRNDQDDAIPGRFDDTEGDDW